jgi:hypothetical protein
MYYLLADLTSQALFDCVFLGFVATKKNYSLSVIDCCSVRVSHFTKPAASKIFEKATLTRLGFKLQQNQGKRL